ncbi:MAG TPA: DUF262 domain-containing protein, partial [Hyphomicrobiaceae bacterium]|nr:DUF262 domain-containing protein [Hyphomicrobiaceae bacterium]
MPDEFRVLLQTLAELLSGARRYRVPSFQRPYSWTTKEALQLLEDLLHWIAQATDRAHDIETRRYFLGTILLVREPADAGEPEADIVDGQQRTFLV